MLEGAKVKMRSVGGGGKGSESCDAFIFEKTSVFSCVKSTNQPVIKFFYPTIIKSFKV